MSHYFDDARIALDPVLRFFDFEHLPGPLRDRSAVFARTAEAILNLCPRNAERTVALRKLLEAKDAAVRAALEDAK